MAAGISGNTIQLQVRTATGPDVYTTVGGQRGMKVTRQRKAIDTSAKDDADDATSIVGRRTSTITMDGLVVAGDAGRAALVAAYDGDGVCRVRRGAVGAEPARQANGVITGLDEDFPDDDASTWTVQVQVSGPWAAIS